MTRSELPPQMKKIHQVTSITRQRACSKELTHWVSCVLIRILRHLRNFGEVNASLEPLKSVFLPPIPLCCWFLATAIAIFVVFLTFTESETHFFAHERCDNELYFSIAQNKLALTKKGWRRCRIQGLPLDPILGFSTAVFCCEIYGFLCQGNSSDIPRRRNAPELS